MIFITDQEYQLHTGTSVFELGNGKLYEIVKSLNYQYTTGYFGHLLSKHNIESWATLYFHYSVDIIAIYETSPAITTERAHSGFGVILIETPKVKTALEFFDLLNRMMKMKAFL